MSYRVKFKAPGDIWFQLPGLILWIIILIFSFGDYKGPIYSIGSTANIIGAILFSIGLLIRLIAAYTLGMNYSSFLVIRKNHKLIKRGLYKYVRHPVYTGVFIGAFAIPVYTSSIPGFLMFLLSIPLFMYRMEIEERMLIEEFGDEYRDYMENTWRLVPFIY
jgi:protein-S-isoprenylcysteine O-methyltransferase Ste14